MTANDPPTNNPYHSPTERALPMKSGPQFFNSRRVIFWLLSLSVITILIGMMMPAVRQVREPARRASCANNLRQISIAIHHYETVHGHLPPAYTVDENGNKLHSWRVLILPYLDHQKLYDSIDLTKPWDDPVNQEARMARLFVYQCPSCLLEPGQTNYLANVASDKFFVEEGEIRKLSDLTSDELKKILVFEVNADLAVEWMSPEDGDLDTLNQLLDSEKFPHPGCFNTVLADATTETFFANEKKREKIINRLVDE